MSLKIVKRLAILQSNYIPWKGYFDLIKYVDEFILFDDVQFTKNDWRNRNRIKTSQGLQWLTVPVGQAINRRIRDVELPNGMWKVKHWKTLENNYRRAPHFEEVAAVFQPLYLTEPFTHLSQLNRRLIEVVCDYLGIKTVISNSWDYSMMEGKTDRLVDMCLQAEATEYISGPAAMNYIDENLFAERNIKLTMFDYSGYPDYPQLWGDFIHEVTILDLLFNCGKEASQYMKHFDK